MGYGCADACGGRSVSEVRCEAVVGGSERGSIPLEPPVMMASLPSRGRRVVPPVRLVEEVLWYSGRDIVGRLFEM